MKSNPGILVLLCAALHAQMLPLGGIPIGGGPITLDASCTGQGSANPVACSSAMTVSAGDTITCFGSGKWFDPVSLYFNDPKNGIYDSVRGATHPSAASTTWIAAGVLANSVGGSVTPQVNNWETGDLNISCYAWKSTRTTKVLDGGGVNLFNSTTASNPTAGTAAAPTNNSEAVVGFYVRPSASTTSAGSGWSPAGTLTGVAQNLAQYTEYQIQTTAASVNAAFTSASAAYTDMQFAVLNTANPAGYRALTGFYGAPAIAKTNGTTVTTADLDGSTTTLASIRSKGDAGWTLSGTAPIYDTSVAPTGTATIMVGGVPHTFGDAGTSIQFSGALTASSLTWDDQFASKGTPMWLSSFFRVGSTGISSSQECDNYNLSSGVTEESLNVQTWYDSTNGLGFMFESFEGGNSPILYSGWSLDTDYWLQIHLAGINERYHELKVYSKSGSVWSLSNTLQYDVLCATQAIVPCTLPTAAATTTGTASSGSTALTVASGTGILAGQIILGTNIPWPTVVAAVSGTSVTLSQATTGALSSTSVSFYTAPTTLIAATNGTVSAGSTALTIVVPGTGTVAVGQPVGGAAFAPGTIVSAVSGTSVTLSQPTNAAMTNGGISFWRVQGNQSFARIAKYSSCNIASKIWFSGLTYDPFGTWGAFAPN